VITFTASYILSVWQCEWHLTYKVRYTNTKKLAFWRSDISRSRLILSTPPLKFDIVIVYFCKHHGVAANPAG